MSRPVYDRAILQPLQAARLSLHVDPGDRALCGVPAVSSPLRSVNQLLIEARKARAFGKPLAEALMLSLARVVPRRPLMLETIEHWPRDLAHDGVIFRLNAGLHALALAGHEDTLMRLYGVAGPPAAVSPAELDRALERVLEEGHEELLGWLSHPTQTNEVARVAGLIAAMLELGRERAMPCEMLEIGASAGLNLNAAHYAVRLGTHSVCAPDSAVRLAPAWRGRAAAGGQVAIAAASGVDLHPLDVRDPAHRQSLEAYVWPGETVRSERLAAAIGVALSAPPQVEAGLASAWLARRLAVPQPTGVRRVVFHAMVLQYADDTERAAIEAALSRAGAQADAERPIARVGIEWRADRQAVEIRVARWDGSAGQGEARLAGLCHPYGEWIDWRGLD